jgi:hypothetical protein
MRDKFKRPPMPDCTASRCMMNYKCLTYYCVFQLTGPMEDEICKQKYNYVKEDFRHGK